MLLLQRNPNARFMGGAWVFPGGAVHADDGDADTAPVRAALRETEEESGLELADTDELIPFSRWITPARGQDPLRHLVLRRPRARGRRADRRRRRGGRRALGPPASTRSTSTRATSCCSSSRRSSTSRSSATFESVDDAVANARARRVMPVQPRVLTDGGVARVVMPGEPGYDDD